jgi:UDP-N-acetylmuramoylalanine--D-glutamate ligase
MINQYSAALVLGAGRSGAAAARLLNREGARVTLVDAGEGSAQAAMAVELRHEGVETLLGVETLPVGPFDVAVFSPGIPADSDWARELEARGIPAIPELDLGFTRCSIPVVAVTGTNGKSTLVKLCAAILQQAGLRAVPAGNYGAPLSEVVVSGAPLDWVVVEASSFQLEKSRWFHPRVGVMLNIYPNHLDRHSTVENYRNAKCRLFACMGQQDRAVVFEEHAREIRAALAHMAPESEAHMQWRTFGLSEAADFRYDDHKIMRRRGGACPVDIGGSIFDNEVLGLSAAAAVAVAESCGCADACVERAASGFEPLAHRMQEVHRIGDVVFVDNSKATTLTALHAALRMSRRPVRLIAGGLLKEYDLSFVKELLRAKVKAVYLIGKAAGTMQQAWQGDVPCRMCGTLDQAVAWSWAEAQPGEMVLLATGCASFDQFKGFAERGEKFTEQVRRLDEKK